MKSAIDRYFYITLVAVGAFFGYEFFGWIGFACWTLFVLLYALNQIHETQKTIMNTLLSRLPDRCAMCHREIVDEGGVKVKDLDNNVRIYHGACSDKLKALKKEVSTWSL